MTNGDARRRLDIEHPELTLTSAEKEEKKDLVLVLAVIGNLFCFLFMILVTVIIVIITSFYNRTDALIIALVGMMLNVIAGSLLALSLGNKLSKICNELSKEMK